MQLSQAIDRTNAAFFWKESLSAKEREQLGKVIVASHSLPGAYASTFALAPEQRKDGILLFTGERTLSAAARHIAGEEACRALRMLEVKDRAATKALDEATNALLKCVTHAEELKDHRMGGNPGAFCCGRCSVSVWRHVLAGGLDRHEERLSGGMKVLKNHRDGDGRWKVFPFWYAVSALAEMDASHARHEIEYAAAILKRSADRQPSADEYARRRSEIARRALDKL